MSEKKPRKKTYFKIPENWERLTEEEKDLWSHEAYDLIIKKLMEQNKD